MMFTITATANRFLVRKFAKYGQRSCAHCSVERLTNNQTQWQAERSSESVPFQTYGQPTPMTHPHLIKEGEVVPGIKLNEFKIRRSKLIENIVSHGGLKNPEQSHIVIIPSSSKVFMSDKIPYVFRQNTDFLYFTGCQEPDSILVITAKKENFASTLFVRQKDEYSELWDGPRTGVAAAPTIFGIDRALPVTEFDTFLLSFLNEHKKCVIWYDNVDVAQPNLHKKLRETIKTMNGQTLLSPTSIIHRLRLIKSQSEIDLMKKSCEIASAAIAKTIQISKPGISEHQLFARVDYECRVNGAEFLAYPPVVAAGKNANIIHYITNNQIVQNGDMVLMDAGCEYRGYSSDITRTWPINGKFTEEQRTLYNVVLEVQNTLIQKLKEMPSLDRLFNEMCALLGTKLQEIGLIPKDLSKDMLLAAAYTYCPHHVSHYLGMDVHDTGKVPRSIQIQPGMIMTVEPGIYVSPKNQFAPSKFHGLGIRIEDDILITEDGPFILTQNCPKEINEIEALASENQ